MALAKDIMGGGFSAGQAQAIQGTINSAVSAAGTVITDATDLDASNNYISTAAASSGVQLPSVPLGDSVLVYNGGANPVKVYPPDTSSTINSASAGVAVLCPVNTLMSFYRWTSTKWVAGMSA